MVNSIGWIIFVVSFFSRNCYGQFFFGGGSQETSFETRPLPCFLPTGKAAFCVALKECTYLSDLVKNLQKPIPGDVALLLKDSFFCPRKRPSDDLEICCPLEAIDPPEEDKPPLPDRRGSCLTQTGTAASCAAYNRCSPFLQLLSNLRRPVPRTLPKLMQKTWVCGSENTGGFRIPKICCPNDAILDEPPGRSTTTTTEAVPETTTSEATTTPASTLTPEEQRY